MIVSRLRSTLILILSWLLWGFIYRLITTASARVATIVLWTYFMLILLMFTAKIEGEDNRKDKNNADNNSYPKDLPENRI